MATGDTYGKVAGAQELERLGYVLAEAFGFPAADAVTWFRNAGEENLRAVRRDGEIIGGFMLVPMAQFFGGRSIRMCGFAGVGMLPWARGSGVGTRLMAEGLRELRATGWPLAGLFPATQPIYRRVGFEHAGDRFEVRAAVRDLPQGDRALPVRPFAQDDLPKVKEVYTHLARARDGWLDRGPYVWNRVQNLRGAISTGYVVGEAGQVEGYAFILKSRRTTFRIDLGLTDIGARTPRAWRRLLTLLADHGSIAEEVSWHAGANDPLLAVFVEQRYQRNAKDTWMLRLLDVEAALTARGYAAGVRGTLELEVTDELLPENAGRYVLEVSGREGKITRGGSGALRCDIRALATLYAGYRSATLLAQLGLVDGGADAIDAADALFAGPAPSMPDMY